MVGSAYLRVFQPLNALPPAERERVELAMVQGDAPEGPHVYRHLGGAGRRLGILESTQERPAVRFEGGSWLACPPRSRLRVLAAMLSLRETTAAEVADALVPELLARRAARELARMRRRDAAAVPTMLESPWHVPVRWFALFDDSERRLVERDDAGFALSYWTAVGSARERAQRAASVLEDGDLRPVAAMVYELDDWLSCFAPDAAVELDYGDVAISTSWNELDEDHSAREVQEAIDALETGELDRASDLYQSVAGRWTEAKIRESLN